MTVPRPLPEGVLVAFYGDDFTGASASMEVLAFAGLPTVLFLDLPTTERLADFSGFRAIGIAGTARAQSPEWMDAHLPAVFERLGALGAPVLHHKVCSTFDSAPHVGSIGRAAEILLRQFGPRWMPMLVADPGMGRFQAFGHLFAMAAGTAFRLDRHPVMSRHPTTPMDEADLGRHLARQTALPIGLVDFEAMKRGAAELQLDAALAAGAKVVSLDVLDAETLAEAGRLIWESGGEPVVGLGSQGFEAALVAHWRNAGALAQAAGGGSPGPVERIACVSGSVSPTTAAQLAHAFERGFEGIRLDVCRVVDTGGWAGEVARAGEAALAALGAGRDPAVFTATGPDDPAVAAFSAAVEAAGLPAATVNKRLGQGLGQVMRRLVQEGGLGRVVIAGGDTSGRAAAELGIDALTAVAPLDPGAPLCRAHAGPGGCPGAQGGLEIVLKGGQVGRPDFLSAVKEGGRA